MKDYVAIKVYGEVKIHLPHTDGNYATLCGEDGDDPNPSVSSCEVEVPKGVKVNCWACIRIWAVCRRFNEKDFDKNLVVEIQKLVANTKKL